MDMKKYGQQYAAPEDRDQFVDVEKGQVLNKDDIPPLEVMKALAARYKLEISDPSKGCGHCYGRGYTGKDLKTGAPIPCNCLFRGRDAKKKYDDMQAAQVYGRWNRKQRRQMEKTISKNRNPSKVADTLEQERSAMLLSATPVSHQPVDIFTPKEEPVNG